MADRSFMRILVFFWLPVLVASLTSRVDAQGAAATQRSALAHSGHQQHAASAEGTRNGDIPGLMVSDIHFDPLHDPARLPQLVDAPVGQWKSILAAQPSPNQAEALDALQKACGSRGVDTPFALLESSLSQMRARRPDAKFLTVSGDLIAHDFQCRFQKLLPQSTPRAYQAFTVKTFQFVVEELRATFPGVPVYVALGNNDSDCGDYRLDVRGDFLAQAGRIIAEGLPAAQRQGVIDQFAEGGYYSVAMAAPFGDTRLIVVNDSLLSPRYTSCGGLPGPAAGDAEMAWLKQQLAGARKEHQQVWVMGHIPPGVNVYSTAAKMMNICAKAKPVMFLASDTMADLMIEYADVIRLGIFAHSHMDEWKLLQPGSGDSQAPVEHRVAIKIVPSISPVDGNYPSFTIARVKRATSILQDYEVIAASNLTGVDTTWSREYGFRESFGETEFSAASLHHLLADFESDRNAETKESNAYLHNFFVGDRSFLLRAFWPQYVCGMANTSAKAYADCVCAGGK
jgi:sphingomyelin phosphodiesterase acid-like 3